MIKYCCVFLYLVLTNNVVAQSIDSESFSKGKKANVSFKNFIDKKFPYTYSNNVLQSIKMEIYKKESDNIRMDSLTAISLNGARSKHSLQYNQNGMLSIWLVKTNTGSGWYNNFLTTFIYDINNNLIIKAQLSWNISKWDSSNSIIYYYNEQGKLFQELYQTYTGTDWLNSYRTTYRYYDISGDIDTAIIETWVNNQWQKSELIHYFYSEQNRKDSILFYIWNGSGWQYDRKTNFYYNNSSTSPDSMLATYWGGGDLWMNYFKSVMTNDSNNNKIEQTDQTWQAFYWQNFQSWFLTYNNFNFVTSAYCKLWDGKNWVDGDGNFTISNPNGFMAGFVTNRIDIYYSNITGIADEKESQEFNFYLSQNYPNPFNPTTIINYYIPKTCLVTLKVYNILGKEVASLVNEEKAPGNHQVQFNAAGLASGIYIYRINAGAFTKSKLMILEK